MQTIRRKEKIALMRCAPLKARVRVDVEQCILNERKVCEACASLAKEDVGDISEYVPFANLLQDGKDT
jgi:hypothetical protein